MTTQDLIFQEMEAVSMTQTSHQPQKTNLPSQTLPHGLAKILAKKIPISQLCEQNAVSRLELFGSATTPYFDPTTSDFDFLVEFSSQEVPGVADRFFNLKQGLTDLLHTTIDLVEIRAVKNPYFLSAIAPSRVIIYGNGTP